MSRKARLTVIKKTWENQDLLSIFRNIIFIVAIYLYFAGWLYAHTYYSLFGIGSLVVDIPFYNFMIYSYSVLSSIPGGIVIFISFALIFIFTSIYPDKWVIVLLLILLIPALFWSSFYAASKDAKKVRITADIPEASFSFKKDLTPDVNSGDQTLVMPPSFLHSIAVRRRQGISIPVFSDAAAGYRISQCTLLSP